MCVIKLHASYNGLNNNLLGFRNMRSFEQVFKIFNVINFFFVFTARVPTGLFSELTLA